MPFGFGSKPGQGPQKTKAQVSDEVREQRLEAVRNLCGKFVLDLANLIAGNEPTFDYLAPGVAQRLKASVDPFLDSGDFMRPNFGPFAELRIEGDLVNRVQPISVRIEFEDQSLRETPQGDLLPAKRRHIEATLLIDPDLQHVRDVTVAPVATKE